MARTIRPVPPQVCEPLEHSRPRRHWSVSIDERRRLAALSAQERPDAAGAPPQGMVRGWREAGRRSLASPGGALCLPSPHGL